MKRVLTKALGSYRKAASWGASFGADRWMHLVAGLLIAYVVGRIAGDPLWSAALVGVLAAFVAGFFKEIADSFTGSRGDLVDMAFTTIGGMAGASLLFL